MRSSFISTDEEVVDVAAVNRCWFVSCCLSDSSSVWKTRLSSASSRLWVASACANASWNTDIEMVVALVASVLACVSLPASPGRVCWRTVW
jgi:hypothetical protein